MDIQVARFREVLALLKPVVPRKTTLPVLTNVMLKDGQVVATDLETIISVPVPEADIACLIPYADVTKMLQYTMGGEMLHIEHEKGKVRMSWPEGSSTFPAGDVKDFPPMPEIKAVAEASLNGDILFPAMLSVLRYTAKDDTRPVLSGVTLVMGDPMRIAAGDGHRMAYQDMDLSFPHDAALIVPSSCVTALHLLWGKTPRTPPPSDELIPVIMAKKQVTVAFDGSKGLRFDFGGAAIAIAKLIEGSPPDWLKLIPKKEPILQVQFWATELEAAARRAQPVALQGSGILRMVFNDSTVTISAKYDDQEVESKIQAFTTKGEPNKVALSVSYLLDYLAGKDGIVTISMTDPESPVILKHQRNPNVIIMPMHAEWQEKSEEVEEPADAPGEEPAADPAKE